MSHREDEIDTLERTLTEAYRAQPHLRLDEIDVTQQVMRDIRQSKGENGRWVSSDAFAQIVWRTANLAAAVVLVLTVLIVGVLRTTSEESPGVLAEEFESASLFVN